MRAPPRSSLSWTTRSDPDCAGYDQTEEASPDILHETANACLHTALGRGRVNQSPFLAHSWELPQPYTRRPAAASTRQRQKEQSPRSRIPV